MAIHLNPEANPREDEEIPNKEEAWHAMKSLHQCGTETIVFLGRHAGESDYHKVITQLWPSTALGWQALGFPKMLYKFCERLFLLMQSVPDT